MIKLVARFSRRLQCSGWGRLGPVPGAESRVGRPGYWRETEVREYTFKNSVAEMKIALTSHLTSAHRMLKVLCHETFLLFQSLIYVVNMTGTHLLNFYYLIF